MITLEVRISCPPVGHEFTAPHTEGPFAILCACERAIMTGQLRQGLLTSRVETMTDR